MAYELSDDDDGFDNNWIKEIEEENKTYHDFFITPNEKITFNIYYINRKNELETGKKKIVNLTNGVLRKSEIVELIRNNMYFNNRKYRLMSVLSYNFDLDNYEVKNYVKRFKDYDFLNVHTHIQPIDWGESINYFKELNDVYIFFVQKKKENNHNKTKRILIGKKLKKTKKKRLK